MKKLVLYSAIALLPVLGSVPTTSASGDHAEPSIKSKSKAAPTKTVKLEKPLQVGAKMINFEIENASGGTITLDNLLESGPVVLTFYRGSWCPYCRGELSSIQARLERITQAGGSVLAISPESPEKTVDFTEQKKLGFTFATDPDNALAKQLALAFKLDAKTIKQYRKYGIDVPESNGTKKWELPIPATYVIDTDHTIKFAFVDEDYSKRADYDEVLSVLKDLQNDG